MVVPHEKVRLLLSAAFVTAGAIVYDLFARGHRQQMWIMEAVWPITALYLGPLGWLAYRRWSRRSRCLCPASASSAL